MSNDMSHQSVEATDADFQQTVIDQSRQVPVLVDFWAPWCEPCKVIGPVLEKLEQEKAGSFKLVKVNMDDNPMLAQALMIQSIPAVKLFVNGEIKDEFMGAYPEPEIRKFLDKNLPVSSDQNEMSALELYFQGATAEAVQIFQRTLAEDAENAEALIGLGHYMADQGQLEEARQMDARVTDAALEGLVDKTIAVKARSALQSKLFFHDMLGEDASTEVEGGASDQEGLEARFRLACQQALQGIPEEALEGFFSIVKENREFRKDAGRKGMVAVFDMLPNDSPLTHSYRNKLSSILFS
ncbi:MAG: tetratricopeptide repeat protein [SAR324 cluster bacterium]|nr:tetratricopeptide repeat protein [SAR324 cluster bacterium]MCZ6534244.1 tetratricopeptide repeat protein [SAR324 cluster bacterium]MCZ6646000.1 tetratricopeptide repeat protein [SAR324 cluster bacterium]